MRINPTKSANHQIVFRSSCIKTVLVIRVARLGSTVLGSNIHGFPTNFSRVGWVANIQTQPPAQSSINATGTAPIMLKFIRKPKKTVPDSGASLGIIYSAAKKVATVARVMLKRLIVRS